MFMMMVVVIGGGYVGCHHVPVTLVTVKKTLSNEATLEDVCLLAIV
jgi:hypothetical protein